MMSVMNIYLRIVAGSVFGYVVSQLFGWVGIGMMAVACVIVLGMIVRQRRLDDQYDDYRPTGRFLHDISLPSSASHFEKWRHAHERKLGYRVPNWVAKVRYEQEKGTP